MKILITAGGTEEPIDGVRRICNISTGRTGAVLARHFIAEGAELMVLHAERADFSGIVCRKESFLSFSDLDNALQRHLSGERWDAIVHLAAVGDYSIASIELDGGVRASGDQGKISSGHELVLRLRPNPKLIDTLRSRSRNPGIIIVAFKLTNEADPGLRNRAVEELMARAQPDFIVHNDLSEIGPGYHRARIFDVEGRIDRSENKFALARTLWIRIKEKSKNEKASGEPGNNP